MSAKDLSYLEVRMGHPSMTLSPLLGRAPHARVTTSDALARCCYCYCSVHIYSWASS